MIDNCPTPVDVFSHYEKSNLSPEFSETSYIYELKKKRTNEIWHPKVSIAEY